MFWLAASERTLASAKDQFALRPADGWGTGAEPATEDLAASRAAPGRSRPRRPLPRSPARPACGCGLLRCPPARAAAAGGVFDADRVRSDAVGMNGVRHILRLLPAEILKPDRQLVGDLLADLMGDAYPPGTARPLRQAAILTPSPTRSPSRSTTSATVTPIR